MSGDVSYAVRWEATKSLARIGKPAVGVLTRRVSVPNGFETQRYPLYKPCPLQEDAVWALGEIGDPAALDTLVGTLAGPVPSLRIQAALALVKFGHAAVNPMLSLACSGSVYDRGRALWVLGRIGDTLGMRPTFEHMLSLFDSRTRSAAALVALKLDRYGPLAYRMLAGEFRGTDRNRYELAKRLLIEAGVPAYDAIASLLSDTSAHVRSTGSEILGRACGQRAVPRLIRQLEDPVIWVRRAAVEQLGAIGGPVAGRALSRFVMDRRPGEDRSAALRALSRVDLPAYDAIARALGTSDAFTRGYVAENLGVRADPRAIAILRPLLHDSDSTVVKAATLALGRSGDTSVVTILVALHCDPRQKRDALTGIHDQAATVALAALLQDSSYLALGQDREDNAVVVRALDVIFAANESLGRSTAATMLARNRLPRQASLYAMAGPVALNTLFKGDRFRPEPGLADTVVDLLDGPAVDTLEALVRQSSDRRRIMLAGVAARHGSAMACSVLTDGLLDANREQRAVSIERLSTLDRAEALPFLLAARSSPDRYVSEQAYRGLAYSRESWVVDTLLADLSVDPVHRRVSAIRALGNLGEKRAFPFLAAALTDTASVVVEAVISVLPGIDPTKAVGVLSDVAMNRDPEHAWYANLAVKELAKTANRQSPPRLTDVLLSSLGSCECDATDGLARINNRKADSALVARAMSAQGVPVSFPQAWPALLRAHDPRVEGILRRNALESVWDGPLRPALLQTNNRILREAAAVFGADAMLLGLDEQVENWRRGGL